MKRIAAAASILFVLAAASATSHSGSLPEVAVTPDHPVYDTKLSVEEEIEELAPNETERAKAKIERAENRLAETATLADRNETELANMTANNYSQEMKELQKFGQQISDLTQKREVDMLVANATMRHTEVLSRVYEKVPEQAKAGITRAMNRSVKGHQAAIQSLNRSGGVPEGLGNSSKVMEKVPGELRDSMGQRSSAGQSGREAGGGQDGDSGTGQGSGG